MNRAVYSVTGTSLLKRNHIVRLVLAALMSFTVILPHFVVPASAATERALYLYYTHTKETARIVFKRNGNYVQSGLNDLNYFLRDWRRNEPAKMDPRLFDLVWEVYQEVGGTQPVHIVSAYRSPKTNEMLRQSSSGVAENSQHTKGNAMDFFIPGVPLAKLRAVAMRKQVGGVGYYPSSGSPFVHLDTGSVRAWPRMTRAQLKEIFPDGRTVHLPTDGKPLSQEGYQLAMAEWKRCHSVPCNGGSSGTQVASAGSGRTLVDMFFGGNKQSAGVSAPSAPAPAVQAAAAPVQVASVPQASTSLKMAPTPFMRPSELGGANVQLASATTPEAIPFSTTGSAPLDDSELLTGSIPPMPVLKSAALQQATDASGSASDAVTALAALTAPPIPEPRVHMTEQTTVTAYLPTLPQDPEAQKALEMLINNSTAAAVTPPPRPTVRRPVLPPIGSSVQTAALGQPPANTLATLFDGTFGAAQQSSNAAVADALAKHVAQQPAAKALRKPELVAPDLEHVADVFMEPAALDSSHFAIIWDHDEADFDPTTELGHMVPVMGVGDVPQGLPHNKFAVAN
jgi:uncharacterized protein YcbK (DUF882 family)